MRDWIVGLSKAATERRAGVPEGSWADLEGRAGQAMPEELKDLYAAMDGASFSSGVRLYPVGGSGAEAGVLQTSRPDWWIFGTRGEQELFAARKRVITEQAGGAPIPEWMGDLADEDWCYGLRKADTNETKLYRTLEHLLGVLVPPAETEEFGENTFARALTAVQGALGGLKPKTGAAKASKRAPPKRAKPAKTKTKAKTKAKAKSRAKPVKRSAAKQRTKKAAKPKAAKKGHSRAKTKQKATAAKRRR